MNSSSGKIEEPFLILLSTKPRHSVVQGSELSEGLLVLPVSCEILRKLAADSRGFISTENIHDDCCGGLKMLSKKNRLCNFVFALSCVYFPDEQVTR